MKDPDKDRLLAPAFSGGARLVKNHPMRVLLVHADASAAEIASAVSRAKALAKLGRQPDTPDDMRLPLPEPDRSPEAVTAAAGALALPAQREHYARFWFPKDDGTPGASTRRRIVLALAEGRLRDAVAGAETIYGDSDTDFIFTLADAVGKEELLPLISNPRWKQSLQSAAREADLQAVEDAIAVCEELNQDNTLSPRERIVAARQLYERVQDHVDATPVDKRQPDMERDLLYERLAVTFIDLSSDAVNGARRDVDVVIPAYLFFRYAALLAEDPDNIRISRSNTEIVADWVLSTLPREYAPLVTRIRQLADAVAVTRGMGINNAILMLARIIPMLKDVANFGGPDYPAATILAMRVADAVTKCVDECLDQAAEQINGSYSTDLYPNRPALGKTVENILDKAILAIDDLDNLTYEPDYAKFTYPDRRDRIMQKVRDIRHAIDTSKMQEQDAVDRLAEAMPPEARKPYRQLSSLHRKMEAPDGNGFDDILGHIRRANTLLAELQSILGTDCREYIILSTRTVNVCLNLIDLHIPAAAGRFANMHNTYGPTALLDPNDPDVRKIFAVFDRVTRAFAMLDDFYMDPDFIKGRYEPLRADAYAIVDSFYKSLDAKSSSSGLNEDSGLSDCLSGCGKYFLYLIAFMAFIRILRSCT